MDGNGNLYGTTEYGGPLAQGIFAGYGTVFELAGAAAPACVQISGLHSSTSAGASQTSTGALQNTVGTTDTARTVTVKLSRRDPRAVLPAGHALASAVGGKQTLSGLMKTQRKPSITAIDKLFSSTTDSPSVDVS